MIHWVLGLSATYFLLLGLLMAMGNQTVSPGVFWLITVIGGVLCLYLVASKLSNIAGSFSWKLQRIAGAYLFVMIPAHLLFMHLNVSIGHEAGVVIARMQNHFIKIMDMAIVVAALYHGGYGLLSVAKDYIQSKKLQTILAGLIVLILGLFGWLGLKLTVGV